MRLWNARGSPSYPLLAYEDRNDYFVGCDASPIHPGLFATTDLSGCLDIWSLNSDHEVKHSTGFKGVDSNDVDRVIINRHFLSFFRCIHPDIYIVYSRFLQLPHR